MKNLYCILLLSLLISCNQDKNANDGPFIINPEKLPEAQITLSEIADDISYIPLDNTITIGTTYSIEMTGNNIYISMKDPGLVKYDRQGNFVGVIARNGRGPGEFQYCFNFAVDEVNDRIYVADRQKVLVYSIKGTFMKEFSTESYFSSIASDIELTDSKIFLCDYGLTGVLKYHWIFLDTAGNLISKKNSSDNSQYPLYCGLSYNFNDNLYYSNILNDTVFSISPEMKSQAAYLFSKGEFRLPIDYQFSTIKDLFKFFRPIKMFESNNYVFIEYSYIDKSAFLIINKASNKSYLGYKNEKVALVTTIPWIVNDLDGGLPGARDTNVNYYSENGTEYITSLINPFELKTLVASDEFKNSTPKYPEKKKELEKLANNIKVTDNPVLMMVKLKK